MYTLSKGYRWYTTPRGSAIVMMYFINDKPYTFDHLSKMDQNNPDIVLEATASHTYTEDEVYWSSFYLLEEQVHPLIFSLELENPNLLPADL